MDIVKVGQAICYLRKRAGYTQKDLADRLGISDKAVSKWERGLGLPEIGYLRKLSILLDTDTDSLLAGDVVHHDSSWRGIIVLDNNQYGINAGTMVYDKPLIYYLISYFLLVGIREILVIGSSEDEEYISSKLNKGEEFGIKLSFIRGSSLADAGDSLENENGNIMLVYGRCLLYGVDQTRFFQKAMINRDRLTLLVLPKKLKHSTGRIAIDQNRRVISSTSEEQLKTQYDFSDIPIAFFPAQMLADFMNERNVSDWIGKYAENNEVYVQILDRGFVEIEVEDWNSLQEAATFMKIVQDRCGMIVYCLEEVAWRRGFISLEQLKKHGERNYGNEYGEYVLSLYKRIEDNQKKNTLLE